MAELFEEKDLNELEEDDELEDQEEEVELDLGLPEPEEVQQAGPVEEYTTDDKINNLDVVIDEIIAGQWGSGQDRRRRLEEAGYSHALVQKELVRRVNHR